MQCPSGFLPALLLLLSLGCGNNRSGKTGPDVGSPDLLHSDLASPDAKTPPDAPLPRPDGSFNLGGACQADHQCSTGLTCDTSQPGGFCTKTCKSDSECGGSSSGICSGGTCKPKCNARSPLNDCRTKYVCRLESGKAWCMAHCDDHPSVCKASLTCHKKSGLCVNPKGGTLGSACGIGLGDCTGTPNGVCLSLISMTKPYCTLPCSPFTAPCPSDVPGARCSAGDAKGEYCLFTCDSKAPKCPHKNMKCKTISKYDLCVQE